MNVYDSELLRNMLEEEGFITVNSPEDADVVIVNTCAVREKPEERGIRYAKEAKRRGKKVILMGCVAQKRKEELLDVADAVVGTREFHRVVDILKDWKFGVLYTDFGSLTSYFHWRRKNISFSEFVTIQVGCDNFCSYCIVPYTRGREGSRPVDDILSELTYLESRGVKEVTLLGQNVNSYFYGGIDFAELLEVIDKKVEIPRIYFTTSHPRDISLKVIHTVKNSKRIMSWFHLPLQAGSTKVLMDMGRGYTKEEYIEIAGKIREIIPEATITTDIMVGFPTESEADFEETLDVVRKVKFDHAYMFIYSPRYPSKSAVVYRNDIPEEVKGRRLRRLIEEVNIYIKERRELMLGKEYEILIEGPSKKSRDYSRGKTQGNLTCIVPGIFDPGTFLKVKIKEIIGLTPLGEPLQVISYPVSS